LNVAIGRSTTVEDTAQFINPGDSIHATADLTVKGKSHSRAKDTPNFLCQM
jgi:hypothetical protein